MKKNGFSFKLLILIILLFSLSCEEQPRGEIDNNIGVSQIGYKPKDKKIAILALEKKTNPLNFTILQVDDDTVFEGEIKFWGDKWGKKLYVLDFTKLQVPGKYKVRWNGLVSYPFYIDKDIWHKEVDLGIILDSFFNFQRCKEHLVEKLRCNTDVTHADLDINLPAYVFDSDGNEVYTKFTFSNATGGWHDATSTDKETVKIAWTAQQLLLAYETNPSIFSIGLESDGLPRILEEARWGIDYLFKIQDVDGGVFLAIKPYDWWMPDSLPRRIIINKETGVTAKVVATWATAYRVLKPIDSKYAERCLNAARKGWKWITDHPDEFISDKVYPSYWTGKPSSIIWAATELFLSTKEENPKEAETYYKKAIELIEKSEFREDIWIEKNVEIETIIYESEEEKRKLSEEEKIERRITKARNSAIEEQIIFALARLFPYTDGQIKEKIEYDLLKWYEFWDKTRNNPYGLVDSILTSYFGLNGWVLQIGLDMLVVGAALNNEEIIQIGKDQIQWIFGKNPFGLSFVVGIGDYYHTRPFKRLVKDSIGAVMPGVIDINRDGIPEVTGAYEWQTDEATLDYSGSLVLVLSFLDSFK